MKTEKIYTQYEENKVWASNLAFFKDEIKIFGGHLSEIVSKNTSKEILAQAEHFQNQLIIQRDYIDRINHEINLSNDEIRTDINKNATAIDHRNIKDHEMIRENMMSFERIFKSLKTELNTFLSKYM